MTHQVICIKRTEMERTRVIVKNYLLDFFHSFCKKTSPNLFPDVICLVRFPVDEVIYHCSTATQPNSVSSEVTFYVSHLCAFL